MLCDLSALCDAVGSERLDHIISISIGIILNELRLAEEKKAQGNDNVNR